MTTIHEQELLEEILLRLPAKSIGRFRCVCKSWNSLLSQPHFIKTHLTRTKQHPIQQLPLLLACDNFFYSLKLQTDPAHQVFDEVMLNFASFKFLDSAKLASCDGLIVVKAWHETFMLLNPTTKEIMTLPEPPCQLDRRYCNTIPGIGYDVFNDDYKVVLISFYIDCYRHKVVDDDKDDMLVNVYSVKNATWKTVDDSPYDHEAVYAAAGVYCNAHIHWIAKRDSEDTAAIVAFDLKEEEFRQVQHPSSVDAVDLSYGELFIVEGCLCLSPYFMNHELECYAMKEYGVEESWTKITIPDPGSLDIKPLCSLGEEQMLLLMDDAGSNEKLVLYNMKQRAFKEIKIHRFPDDLAVKGTFLESLISPHYVYRDETVDEE